MNNTYPKLRIHDLSWCLRRAPTRLLKLLKMQGKKLFVAGGYVRSCVANEPINDIDVFAINKQEAQICAQVLAVFNGPKVFESDNAYSIKVGEMQIQFIHRWVFNSPQEAIDSFDFTIAKGAFWYENGEWQSSIHPDFYADLASKRLVYTSPVRNEDAGGSMLRVLKFYQRGYRIPLDSLGAVIARLVSALKIRDLEMKNLKGELVLRENDSARVLTGLLRAVDPNIDPSHEAHLPSLDDSGERLKTETT
jgi:hypothetical protein